LNSTDPICDLLEFAVSRKVSTTRQKSNGVTAPSVQVSVTIRVKCKAVLISGSIPGSAAGNPMGAASRTVEASSLVSTLVDHAPNVAELWRLWRDTTREVNRRVSVQDIPATAFPKKPNSAVIAKKRMLESPLDG
jgi:hypothetical protein